MTSTNTWFGVWHSDDQEWIMFTVISSDAYDMAADHEHLQVVGLVDLEMPASPDGGLRVRLTTQELIHRKPGDVLTFQRIDGSMNNGVIDRLEPPFAVLKGDHQTRDQLSVVIDEYLAHLEGAGPAPDLATLPDDVRTEAEDFMTTLAATRRGDDDDDVNVAVRAIGARLGFDCNRAVGHIEWAPLEPNDKCSTMGHEAVSADGLAQVDPDDVDRWSPYCEYCLSAIEHDYPVRRPT